MNVAINDEKKTEHSLSLSLSQVDGQTVSSLKFVVHHFPFNFDGFLGYFYVEAKAFEVWLEVGNGGVQLVERSLSFGDSG
jgi:hypothetical protein